MEVVVGNDVLDPAIVAVHLESHVVKSEDRVFPTSSQLRAISFTPRFAKSLLSICTLEEVSV